VGNFANIHGTLLTLSIGILRYRYEDLNPSQRPEAKAKQNIRVKSLVSSFPGAFAGKRRMASAWGKVSNGPWPMASSPLGSPSPNP